MSMTECPAGSVVFLHQDEDLPDYRNFDIRSGPAFLRNIQLRTQDNFDRMTDSLIISMRYAPESCMRSSGFTFIKRALAIDLPESGTAERDGADFVLRAFAALIGDVASDL
jgi:hypothetical protein